MLKKLSNFLMCCKYSVDATEVECAGSVTSAEQGTCIYRVLRKHLDCISNTHY